MPRLRVQNRDVLANRFDLPTVPAHRLGVILYILPERDQDKPARSLDELASRA